MINRCGAEDNCPTTSSFRGVAELSFMSTEL